MRSWCLSLVRVLSLCLLILFSTAAGKSARYDQWRVLGPGGGGAQFMPTISPHDPNHVLVGCDMTGSYVTDDGGGSWRMFNLRGRTHFFSFDPAAPGTIYDQGIGLWRSTDAGASWNLVYPAPANVTGLVMPDDHADVRIMTTEGPAPAVLALAIDPADSRKMLAAFASDRRTAQLRASADWGGSWTDVREFAGGVRKIYVDPHSPADSRTIYVIGAGSVSVRERGEWKDGPAAPGSGSFADISAGFPQGGGPPVIYATVPARLEGGVVSGGIVVSSDGGQSWKQAGSGILEQIKPARPLPDFPAIATSLDHPEVAYVSAGRLNMGSPRSLGVAKTVDSGKTWRFVWLESGQSSKDVDDGWVSERFGPGWGDNPLSLGVSPANPDLCYGTDYGRTLKSADGGKTWKAVYTQKQGEAWASTGLDVTTCYGVHFDPFDHRRLFISYTDIGLFRSEDGGRSWVSSTVNGVPRDWVNTTYWVEFDPDVRGRMWAVMSGTHDLPRPKMWRRASPSSYGGGVCRSDDGGKTWTVTTQGMAPTAATHILLDRRSPSTSRVLYVAGFGRGVFKTTDGGTTWVLKNNGLPAKEPFAWRLAQDNKGVLYLVIARRSDDGSFGNDGDGGLYRSKDGAETWQKVDLPPGVNGPNGLAIDPSDTERMYLAAWRRNDSQPTAGGGIFLSEDGGASWRSVLSADQHVYDVTIDARNAGVLFACGFESSAWRSSDRGETWQRIRGYNFKWGHRVIPDPSNPDHIYVTTFGGSLWYGPAAGDRNAREDIATPQLRFSR
jgi:photosystem II stability/assembly factor-like uncharacterized protein